VLCFTQSMEKRATVPARRLLAVLNDDLDRPGAPHQGSGAPRSRHRDSGPSSRRSGRTCYGNLAMKITRSPFGFIADPQNVLPSALIPVAFTNRYPGGTATPCATR